MRPTFQMCGTPSHISPIRGMHTSFLNSLTVTTMAGLPCIMLPWAGTLRPWRSFLTLIWGAQLISLMKMGYVLCSSYRPQILAYKKLQKSQKSFPLSHPLPFLALFMAFYWAITMQTLRERNVWKGNRPWRMLRGGCLLRTPLQSRRDWFTGLWWPMIEFPPLW